jgi:hypothetical protein
MNADVKKVISMAQAMGFAAPSLLQQEPRESVDVKSTLINSLNDMKSKLENERGEALTMNDNRKKADEETIAGANTAKKTAKEAMDTATTEIENADSDRSAALEALNESQSKLKEAYDRLLATTNECQEAAKQYDIDMAAMKEQQTVLKDIAQDIQEGNFLQIDSHMHIWKDNAFLQIKAAHARHQKAMQREFMAFEQEEAREKALTTASPFKSIRDLISKLIQDLHDDQAADEAKFGQCWTDINEAKASRKDANDRLVEAADLVLKTSSRIVSEQRETDAARRAHKFNTDERSAAIAHQKALNEWASGRVETLEGMIKTCSTVISKLRGVIARTTSGDAVTPGAKGMKQAQEIFVTVRGDMQTTVDQLKEGMKTWKAEMWEAVKVFSKGSAEAKTKFKLSNGSMERAASARDNAVAALTASQDATMIATNSLINVIYPACADLAGNMNTGAKAQKQKEAEQKAENARKEAEIAALGAAKEALEAKNN